MSTKEQVNKWLHEMMSTILDEYLAVHGFSRKKNSNRYIRIINDVKQEIEITTFYKPHYAKEVNAHIYPNLVIVFPRINKIALDMVSDRTLLANEPDITLRQPIDFVAPNDQRDRWFLHERNSIAAVGQSIINFLDKWVIQFLNDYSTPEGIIKCYEADDKRTLAQDHWYIHVAACYVVLNRLEDAKKVLFERFFRQASRIRYKKAFNYLETLGSEI